MLSHIDRKDARRMAALDMLRGHHGHQDPVLLQFARLASLALGVPGCFIAVVDKGGLPVHLAHPEPLLVDASVLMQPLCATGEPVWCSDTAPEERLHPLAAASPDVRFYACAPLRTRDGSLTGTIGLTDTAPHPFDDERARTLALIAGLTGAWLETLNAVGFLDPVTRLPNRQKLLDDMERLSASGSTERYTLMIFDCIDMPTAYELARSLGMPALETLLNDLGPLLRMKLRLKTDTVLYNVATGRYALLLKTRSQKAIRRNAATLPLVNARMLQGINIRLNIFAGEVGWQPEKTTPNEALRRAISAVHEAIWLNTRHMAFDPARDEKRNVDFQLLHDLSESLAKNRGLYLMYQPKIKLSTSKAVGVEALLRWRHPTRGEIPPGVFIPLAQNTSLMDEITQWVIGAALEQLQEWRLQGITLPVSVNISVSDLSRSGFADALEARVLRAGLVPNDIRIECLETEKALESETALNEMDMLKLRGFKILLDDFGAGYSNINYLRRIPIDIIKLDRSLTSRIAQDRASQIIVRNVIQMLKELDYVVLAEGVEDAETARLLLEFGCDEAQGYYFSRPVNPEYIAPWV
ncbi:EAL domain-containing protein [Cronobacter dublinensis]|uniref:EAL domain-containing protein n=1 Tax=Cronobacter dublinensis TaxID=413497 RepID=A0A9Q4SZQ5_9ENTR|nr:EAL domain-containing protein [Cronobacter dublinensis]EKK4080246.1 EAL domain-containing protein [Cronobacter dublinensis]ELQ5995118.1 EAL domain-containing protein [Cronobacter dublinensis]ELY3774089.1 EAL domain-containing protein [Cronobacter dublinensis]NCH86308.1 EAL domain-containing protein [Cronobacter dublinensis]